MQSADYPPSERGKEGRREYLARYRAANREKLAAYHLEWRRKNRNPAAQRGHRRAPQPLPLLRYIGNEDANGCIKWTGAISPKGYGHYQVDGRPHRVHRFTYELVNGPIEAGLDLHHTCGNRRCVNPGHLEPLSRAAHRKRHTNETSLA